MDGACFVWISVVYRLCYVYWKQTKKKDIVHDVFSGHNDVHLWNVYQIKKKNKTKTEKAKKKKIRRCTYCTCD